MCSFKSLKGRRTPTYPVITPLWLTKTVDVMNSLAEGTGFERAGFGLWALPLPAVWLWVSHLTFFEYVPSINQDGNYIKGWEYCHFRKCIQSIVAHANNPSTWKMEIGRPEVEATLGYIYKSGPSPSSRPKRRKKNYSKSLATMQQDNWQYLLLKKYCL